MNNRFDWNFLKHENNIACVFNGKNILNKVFEIKIKIFLNTINELESIKNIAVILDRSDNLLAVLCASLIGNYTYIPIDPTLPINRINYMLENGNVDLIITSSKYEMLYQSMFMILNVDNVFSMKNSLIKNSNVSNDKNEIAYIIYTSGTTGNPKGVEIRRDSLINFIEGVSKRIDFSAGKRILCSTTVSFDIFFLETIMALYKGVTIVLANDEEYQNPKLLANLIEDNNVNMLQMTPSKIQLMKNYDKDLKCFNNIKDIMVGGEIFTPSLLKTLKHKTNAKIYNMYGPTETAIWVTISELTNKEEIDLGTPIQNIQIYIIDDNQNIITDGQVGQIAIAGVCLAECYHGDEQLTKDKFIYLSTENSSFYAYKTGDLGRISGNCLFYIGRKDSQIKIRGNRIELEEIELVLNKNRRINQCVVTDLVTDSNDKILVAFILENLHINDDEICLFLREYLPEYMIPDKFIRVEKFEYTFNEKIDRRLLKEKYLTIETDLNQDNDSFDLQNDILNVIKSNIDQTIFGFVKLDMDLSNSGVDSITFIKIVVALEEAFNFEFDDDMLLFTAFPTIKSMVEYVEKNIT